jgi:hypothetical protein
MPFLVLLLSFTLQDPGTAGTVYVYRYNQFNGKAVRPSVYCDDKEVGRIQSGRQFSMVIPAGHHTFRSNDDQAVVSLDVKSGETYYLRVDIANGFVKGHGRLLLVPREQGTEEIKRLDPADRDMIRDVDHVVMKSVGPSPSPNGSATENPASLSAPPATALTNEDVIKLTAAGLSDSAIVAKIRSTETSFKTDTDALVALRKAGVSSAVIEAMLTRK